MGKPDVNRRVLLQGLLELTPAERIEIAEFLWDSIEPQDMPPLTSEQEQEIERRLAEHLRDPTTAVPWEIARARLLSRYRRDTNE